jgi:hypothetical protein
VLWHQDFLPDRSIFWARRNRQILLVDIHQLPRQQRRRPVRISGGRRLIQHGQDALSVLRTVLGISAAIPGLAQAGHAVAGVTDPPLRRSAGCAVEITRDGT